MTQIQRITTMELLGLAFRSKFLVDEYIKQGMPNMLLIGTLSTVFQLSFLTATRINNENDVDLPENVEFKPQPFAIEEVQPWIDAILALVEPMYGERNTQHALRTWLRLSDTLQQLKDILLLSEREKDKHGPSKVLGPDGRPAPRNPHLVIPTGVSRPPG